MPTPTLRDNLIAMLDAIEPWHLQPEEVISIDPARPPRPAIIRVTRACIRRIEDDGGPPASVINAVSATTWRLSRNGVVFTAYEFRGGDL